MGYIAASLIKDGHKVNIYNAEAPKTDEIVLPGTIGNLLDAHADYIQALKDADNHIWQEIASTLAEYKPEMVGITVKTAKYSSACMISSLCKRYNQNCYVVWGGPHPTIQPQEVMSNNLVDFVVIGEGEMTMVELARAFEEGKRDLAQIPGLSFRKDGRVIHNEVRLLTENLDEFPFPARDMLLYPERYSANDFSDMITSRGCPSNCRYCGAKNIWTRRVRFRSIPNVISELKKLRSEYGIGKFHFWDDSFTVNRKRTMELCREMTSQRIELDWGCTTRLDLIDGELLIAMSRAGCVSLSIGVESGSQRIQKLIEKNIRIEDVIPGFKLIKKRIPFCYAYFMVGFPQETRQDIEETIKLMENLGALGVGAIFSIFTPYPGTELYNLAQEQGMLPKISDWSLFSHQSPDNYFSKDIPKDEFAILVQRMAKIVDHIETKLLARRRTLNYRWRYRFLRRHYLLRDPRQFTGKLFRFLTQF